MSNFWKAALANAGWLICNGEEISRSAYSDLFAVIGTSYGAGNSTTTYNLPDLRGRFVRGVDHGAGRDPDAKDRTSSSNSGQPGNTGDHVGSAQDSKTGLVWNGGHMRGGGSYGAVFPELPDNKMGESRPVNIYVNWIIKAKDV